ncbi:DUF1822 family protein [Leptolyngbya sp. NIES-2104]|uniref:DUF1822 family protein n=1 Tax=Leptolyngbya sp. NIES-2104 TaxID=1552121 RepID=UPI0006ECA446|nr:DUF1822 family protein [Leptolyngbya sp. NIES-2104]GAP94270.1 hypothetical protein NIES2104_07810 [Leptolyngbya sp. NIES-2104]
MVFTLTELQTFFPHQLWLEVSERTQTEAWQTVSAERNSEGIAQQSYSNAAARWTAYLNTLCLTQFLAWLEVHFEKEDLSCQFSFDASVWEVVNGTALTIGQTRVVLIPVEQSRFSEVCIPQEWIDIPDWIPDYYLAVQLNLDECWMRVCGYATRAQILKRSHYDRMTQTYVLSGSDLIENLDVMWVAQDTCATAKPELQALPSLLSNQVECLLTKLSDSTAHSPRLTVPFSEWAAILTSNHYRHSLHQRRIKQDEPVVESDTQIALT